MSFSDSTARNFGEDMRSESVHQLSYFDTITESPSLLNSTTSKRPSLKSSLKTSWLSHHGSRHHSDVDAGLLKAQHRRSASLPRSWGMTTHEPHPASQTNSRSHSLPSTPPTKRARTKSVHFDDEKVRSFALTVEREKHSAKRVVEGDDFPSYFQILQLREEYDAFPPIPSILGGEIGGQPGGHTLQPSDLGPVVSSRPWHRSLSNNNESIPGRSTDSRAYSRSGSSSSGVMKKSYKPPSLISRPSSSSTTSSSSGSSPSVYQLASTSSSTTTLILEPRFDPTAYYALALAGPAYYNTQWALGGGASSASSYSRPRALCRHQPESMRVGGGKGATRPSILARSSSSSNSTSSSNSSYLTPPSFASSSSSVESSSTSSPSSSSPNSHPNSFLKPHTRHRRLVQQHRKGEHSSKTHAKRYDQAAYYALALAGPVYYRSQRESAVGESNYDGSRLLSEYRSRGQAWATWVVGVA